MPRFGGIPVDQPAATGPRFKGVPVGDASTDVVDPKGTGHTVSLIPTQTEGDTTLATYGFGGPASSTTKSIAPKDRDFYDPEQVRAAIIQARGQNDTGGEALLQDQLDRLNAKANNPVNGMSNAQRFAAGAGKAAVDTGRGISQLGLQAANVASLGQSDTLGKAVDASKRSQDEVTARDSPLVNTGAGFAGNLAGYAALTAVPGSALRLAGRGLEAVGAAGAGRGALLAGNELALPNGYRSAATVGGAEGLAQPVGDNDYRVANAVTGAVGGAVGRAIPQGIGALIGVARRALPAVTEGMRTSRAATVLANMSHDPDQVRAALSQIPNELVPGSRPTTAEVTGDVGLASLQRNLANLPEFSNDLAQRRTQNNASRIGYVESKFGGANDAAADAARASRDRAALPLLNQAKQATGVDVPALTSLADRIIDKRAGNPAVQGVLQRVRDVLGDTDGSVAQLYNARQFVDTLFKDGQDTAAKASRRELQSMKMAIDHEIGKVSPEFGQYLDSFRNGSRVADQVDVGSKILGASDANLDQLGNPVLSAAKVARYARDPDALVQQATTFKRNTAGRILDPDQSQALQDLSQDLSRQANTAVAGKAVGSNTVQNMAGMGSVQDALGPIGAAGIAGGPVGMVATAGLNKLRSKMGEKVYGIVREAMLNPDRAAEVFAQLPKKQQRQILLEYGPSLGIGASQPLVRAAFQSE